MPTYGYRCKSCEHSFEVVQSISDDPIKECPKCGGRVGKIFFPVGIAFKGSGFHINDYKSPRREVKEKTETGNGGNGSGSECAGCASAGTCSTE